MRGGCPHGRQTAKEPAPVHRRVQTRRGGAGAYQRRPIAEIARELGSMTRPSNWVRQDRIDRGEQAGLSSDERARLGTWSARTRARGWSVICATNRRLLGHRDVDTVTRYRCVDAQKAAGFPVAAACKAAGVTCLASCAWTIRAAHSAAERQRAGGQAGQGDPPHPRRSRGTYGACGCTPSCAGAADHQPQAGGAADGRPWHRRLPPRRRRSLTRRDRGAAPAPDLLGRRFHPDRPTWPGAAM